MLRPSRFLLIGALSLGLVACSSDSDSSSSETTAATEAETDATSTTIVDTVATDAATTTVAETTTTEAPTTTVAAEPLRILVTNDDGYASDGIDTVVEAMRAAFTDAEITVIAPAENQSGTSDKTTPGALTVTDVTTKSGYAAKAVAGFPADTVIYALDQGGVTQPPHLVVSGINKGQNIGPFVPVSGTVGAARTAAKRGIPAIASSQMAAIVDPQPVAPDYAGTAAVVVAWIEQNYDNLLAGSMPPLVYNVNGPTCSAGDPRDVVTVPLASGEGQDLLVPSTDCSIDGGAPVDDFDAIVKGFYSYTELDPNTLTVVNV